MRTVEFETSISLLVWDEADDAFWDKEFPVIVKAVLSNVIGEDGRRYPSIEDYEVRYFGGQADGALVEDENIPTDRIYEEIYENYYMG